MQFLRRFLDRQERHFKPGGKLKRYYPLYEMVDTFLYTPNINTRAASHIRDGLDLKRTMLTVIAALGPVLVFCLYNTGYQANLAISAGVADGAMGWRDGVIRWLGLGYDPRMWSDNLVHGLFLFIPIFLVVQITGGFWELLFSIVRKHEINEGFLVTGMLIPLILPPSLPLWQVAVGTSFGIVIGKEIFGGTGMNILNPALTARAFLFFAYPAELSGDFVWTGVDGFSGATPLAQFAAASVGSAFVPDQVAIYTPYVADPWGFLAPWWRNFLGLNQGSIGETSTLACLIGAAVLLVTKIGSWRIMLSTVVGMVLTAKLFNLLAPYVENPMFQVPPIWHFVIGGFAFGTVYMATDPVSAAMTEAGKYVYGFLIGALAITIRVINPAFPEGMMLSILFMNIFSPIIDHFVVAANIRRRRLRSEG